MFSIWFSSRLYYPFGKGPGQHIIRYLKNKKCENERTHGMVQSQMVKGASAKRSPLPWRAGGKKQPVSPGAAYRAASTNPESPYWRRGVVLLQDSLEIFGRPLQIVKTVMGRSDQPGWPAPLLPLDHYGCGLGCALFTGTLAAVEEHERGCARWLHNFLPEDLHATFSAATQTS